jgi:hypothetical protein
MKWFRGIGIGVVVIVLAAVMYAVACPRYLGPTRSGKAALQAKDIVCACEAYRDNPGSGKKYPNTLIELVRPPFGGGSYLQNGEADLIDPWGNRFEYRVEPNAAGETEVRVWTVGVLGGKQKVIGATRHANGEVEVFGRE